MIFTQVTLQVETTVKKPNGAEENTFQDYPLPAMRDKIIQSRIDENSMQGLGKSYRWQLDNIGELEGLAFQFFRDEYDTKFTRTMWERDPKSNKMILEGRKANEI